VKAKALGMDHDWDAGLAKIQTEGKWPFVPMAKEPPRLGAWCLATGHPGGIFSDRKPPLRLGRVLVVGDGTDPLEGIQTDATVYPGDSGGPLFNLQGEVIAIHSNIGYDVVENRHVPVEIFHQKWDDFVQGKEFGEPLDLDDEGDLLNLVYELIPYAVFDFYETIASWFTDDPEWYALTKDSVETLSAVNELTTPLRRTLVDVFADDEPVAMGVAVSRRGQILTKLSVLQGKLTCVIGDEEYEARIVARHEEHDLALLELRNAPRLKPVVWAEKTPQPGAWLVTPDIDASPLSLGIVSNGICKVKSDPPPRGALRVEVADAEGGGVRIKRVIFGGPAALAGIRVDDCLVEFDGRPLADAEALLNCMEKTKPGQEVALKVKRSDKEMQIRLTLAAFVDEDEEYSGQVSRRRGGFPAVFAHDSAIIPEACGSPVLDLDGRVVGLNIARAGRTTTYAIPAEELSKIVPRLQRQAKNPEVQLAKKQKQNAPEAEAAQPMLPSRPEKASEAVLPSPLAP
jgi:serine protease Do